MAATGVLRVGGVAAFRANPVSVRGPTECDGPAQEGLRLAPLHVRLYTIAYDSLLSIRLSLGRSG